MLKKESHAKSHHMEIHHSQKALNWFRLHQNILFMVGVFSMHRGCCSLKVIKFDLDFIGVHSNLLSYLWGFACVSGKDEAPALIGVLSSFKDLIKC